MHSPSVISRTIDVRKLDVFVITETWQVPGDHSCFENCVPAGYRVDVSRGRMAEEVDLLLYISPLSTLKQA